MYTKKMRFKSQITFTDFLSIFFFLIYFCVFMNFTAICVLFVCAHMLEWRGLEQDNAIIWKIFFPSTKFSYFVIYLWCENRSFVEAFCRLKVWSFRHFVDPTFCRFDIESCGRFNVVTCLEESAAVSVVSSMTRCSVSWARTSTGSSMRGLK